MRAAFAVWIGVEVVGKEVGARDDGGVVSFFIGGEASFEFPRAHGCLVAVGCVPGFVAYVVDGNVGGGGFKEFHEEGIGAAEVAEEEFRVLIFDEGGQRVFIKRDEVIEGEVSVSECEDFHAPKIASERH